MAKEMLRKRVSGLDDTIEVGKYSMPIDPRRVIIGGKKEVSGANKAPGFENNDKETGKFELSEVAPDTPAPDAASMERLYDQGYMYRRFAENSADEYFGEENQELREDYEALDKSNRELVQADGTFPLDATLLPYFAKQANEEAYQKTIEKAVAMMREAGIEQGIENTVKMVKEKNISNVLEWVIKSYNDGNPAGLTPKEIYRLGELVRHLQDEKEIGAVREMIDKMESREARPREAA